MEHNSFTFKGVNSLSYYVYVVSKNVYDAAERDITFQSIAGRSGDLLVDNGRFKNVQIKYDCVAIPRDKIQIDEKTRIIKGWLQSETGYFALKDTFNQNFFRLACATGEIAFDEMYNGIAKGTINFNCKPYLYSIEGQKTVTLSEPDTIYNAFAFGSVPYLKIYGNGAGTLTINGTPFRILNIDTYVEIEGETGDAMKDGIDCNSLVNYDYAPELIPGENRIEWGGGITKIEIIPRWRTL